jgi:predicted transcriptional regulator of viral defense system
MDNKLTEADCLLTLPRKQPILRVKDLLDEGTHPEHLRRLHKKGVVERTSRGVNRLAKTQGKEHQALAEVAKRVPHSVVCLLSALEFHQIGTQIEIGCHGAMRHA